MIAITRYRVPEAETETFTERARAALNALAACPGHLGGHLGRAADDPSLWVVVTQWEGAGFYRRALGTFDVRISVIPMSASAIDEPGAFEIVK